MSNIIAKFALLLLVLSFPTGATAQQVEVGTGIICDTQKQVERFVSEFTTTEATLQAINADNTNACGVLPVAYIRGEKVSQVRNTKGTYDVVAIIVVGVVTQIGLQHTPPMHQYTLFQVKEEDA